MKKKQRASSPPMENEADYLRRARNGERAAYGDVVTYYRQRAYAAALAIVRNPEDARDLSQEAFVRAYKNLKRFELTRPFYPWFHRILRNLCLDHLQRHGPHRFVSYDELLEESHVQFEQREAHLGGSVDNPRERIYAEEMSHHLKEALGRLKDEFREILIMRHFEEMSYQDIAESLQIPQGTVMSRLYHARKALATEMKEFHDS